MTDLAAEAGPAVERVSFPRTLAAYGSLLLLAIAVYAPTLRHDFVWDDHEQVRDNEFIRQWSSFPEFWKKDILALSRKGGLARSNYYRPLFYTQYLLYYQWFELNTRAWHALAILQHFFASAAVLFFLRRLGFVLAVAWPAALLFVVHPAHGESVSWIAAAFNDPPAATLLLLGLSAYAMWAIHGRWYMLALAILGYAGGLCMKESALSMLLLAPLVHWYVLPRATLRSAPLRGAVGMASLVLLTIGYFVLRSHLFGFAFGNYEGTKTVRELAPTFPSLALYYVRFLVWPLGFSPSYPLRYIPGWEDIRAWGGLAAVLALTVAVWIATRKSRPLRFAAFWTAFSIWPVFNIRSFRPEYLVHQRYLYLACLSICLAVAWLAMQWLPNLRVRRGVIATVVLIWAASNLAYNPGWKNDHNLWTRVTAVDPANAAGIDWLINEARLEGNVALAESLIERSIAIDPDRPYPYVHRAMLLSRFYGRPAEAIPWYEKALALHWARQPFADYVAIAELQFNYADCLGQAGLKEQSLQAFVDAAEIPPYSPQYATHAAWTLLEAGRGDDAYAVLARAADRHPESNEVIYRTITIAAKAGRLADAIHWSEIYIQRFPNDPQTPDIRRRLQAISGR